MKSLSVLICAGLLLAAASIAPAQAQSTPQASIRRYDPRHAGQLQSGRDRRELCRQREA